MYTLHTKYTGYEKSRERSLFKVKFCHSEIYSSRNWTNKSKPRLQIDMFYGAVWCCMKSCFREATGSSARQYIQYTSGIKCYHFFFLNFSMLSIVLLSVTSSPCASCALSSTCSTRTHVNKYTTRRGSLPYAPHSQLWPRIWPVY